jgi:hypothetical protein
MSGAGADPVGDASAKAVLSRRGAAGTSLEGDAVGLHDDAGPTSSMLGTGAEGRIATSCGVETWSIESATGDAGAPDVAHGPSVGGGSWGRASAPCNAHESG